MDLNNLSNGKTDGLILMYVKDGVTYPVALKESQLTMLDLVIAMPFKESPLTVIFDKPQGEMNNLLVKDGE
jgi:hypothetical protein